MEARRPHFSNQFCSDIEREVVANFENYDASLRSDLQLYNNDGKLKFINEQLIATREYLKGSIYKTWFSVKDIKADLKGCLEKYFELQPISYATEVEHTNLIEPGFCYYNNSNQKIVVRLLKINPHREKEFDFSRLNQFKKMIQHIIWCMKFLRLKKLDGKIRNKKNDQQNEHPDRSHSLKKNGEEPKIEKLNNTFRLKKFSLLFKEGAWDLFYYLNTEYIKDDKSPKAKYSSIYHYLKYLHLIAGTQLEYIEFIESEMGVGMSKILPENIKYTDNILPLLKQLKSNFDRGNKNE